ncbi:MAG: GntR family transcriptional regulator [Trueperaceae bacterium]|nr:GntR family transcriptional regulator [Truepera sp.]HRQ10980.1 GntR family transcriptional regulator [Trueperaceae bacterium]
MADFQRPRTVAAGVYLHLRRELLAGTLEPGAWLREQELAKNLQVSRTPVREAVRQLAQEGLLVIEPNRGVRVPRLSLEEAVDTYAVREPLEAMAARLAAARTGASDHAELAAHLAAMEAVADDDFPEHIRTDDAFHSLVARLSGNPVLQETIERLSHRVMRVKILTRDVNTSAAARAQHGRIVAAITSNDPNAAAAAMAEHIRTNLEIVRDRLGLEARRAADGS